MRHINLGLLWIQEKGHREELAFGKVLGTENPAEMMTKNLDAIKIDKFSSMLRQDFRPGRSKEGLKVTKTGGTEGKGIVA